MNSLVSIVLPTFNGERFLKQSIESCLNQSYKNIELIIVNDCSTDNTYNIVNSFQDERIIYIENKVNQKLPKSLNIGFENASGVYYTWTSDDNYFHVDAIKKMIENLTKSNADIVCAPYFTIDENNSITGSREVGVAENILLDNIVKACFLYKKEVHVKLDGYKSGLFLVEDYDYWIRAVYYGFSITNLEDKLYYYRFHDDSLTGKRRREISKALYAILVHHYIKFKNNNKHIYLSAKLYRKLCFLALANGDYNSSKIYMIKAIKMKPLYILNKEFYKFIYKLID